MKTRSAPPALYTLLAIAAVSAMLTGCGAKQPENSKSTKSLEKVTICQWGQLLIYLPLYIAQHEGLFAEQGLDVNYSNGGADDLTWAAVTSGSAQFGVADPVMVAIQAAEGGVPGRVIGTVVGKVSFWAVSLNKEQPTIETPSQFRGQTVAAFKFPNTAHALALRTFQKGGLKVGEDVKMVEVNYGAVLAQLQSGNATLAMVLEPTASEIEAKGGKIVYSYPGAWGNFAFTGLTTTEKLIKQRPDLVLKVVTALDKAVRLAHSDHQRAIECAKKTFPDIDPNVLAKAVNRMLDEEIIPKTITPDAQGWKAALELCVEVGKLKTMPTAPDAFLDPSFANGATK